MTEKDVFIDNFGKVCATKYVIKATWDEFGGIAEGYATLKAGSEKALKEGIEAFKKGFKKEYPKEYETLKFDIKEVV